MDFVAVSKSNEAFFVLEITCLRYSRNVHLVLKCFKRNARFKKSDYSNVTSPDLSNYNKTCIVTYLCCYILEFVE